MTLYNIRIIKSLLFGAKAYFFVFWEKIKEKMKKLSDKKRDLARSRRIYKRENETAEKLFSVTHGWEGAHG